MARSKYGNLKVTMDGKVFDSRHEAQRYFELSMLARAGKIQDLQTQVKYVLIPALYAPSTEVYKSGPRKGSAKPGRLLEREVSYVADFVYRQDGETVVEDAKGFRTKDYVIKRKLMLWVHGIQIREV